MINLEVRIANESCIIYTCTISKSQGSSSLIITELLIIITSITQFFFFAVIKKIYSCIFQIFKQYAIIWYRKRFLPSRRLIVNLPNVNDLHIPIYFQRMAKEIDFWGLMLVF